MNDQCPKTEWAGDFKLYKGISIDKLYKVW
jgi:hypothetical protein